MGQKEINLPLPCGYDDDTLNRELRKRLRLREFRCTILRKSLDSRRKDRIHWELQVRVESPEIPSEEAPSPEKVLQPLPVSSGRKAVVAGTGPAGIFAALYLQRSGVQVTLLERGRPVEERRRDILRLEERGEFTPDSNYSFGEGGAGTFSDGKLTSRSKHIKKEKLYILRELVRQGAPEEILYLTHPHIGSDNLIRIAANMRRSFLEAGGALRFDTRLSGIDLKEGRVRGVETSGGDLACDYLFLATGHSSYDSFRMLLDRGLPFRPKNFALGFRMEHSQERINRIQWGRPALPGVKAAEYRLSSHKGELPVYSFCMCPGGRVVPAAAYEGRNIVNGMSLYQRDGEFANAALVAGVAPEALLGKEAAPGEVLDWLDRLEQRFFQATESYEAPAMAIGDFLRGRGPETPLGSSSYEPGLVPRDLAALLPPAAARSLREGLGDLCRRMPGFEEGQIMGLESKTSAPIQVIRDRVSALAEGTENLFICGEASGYAGGIVSSASDGLRAAAGLAAALR